MTDNDEDSYKGIHRQNMIVLAFVVVLLVFGGWLMDAFRKHVKLEECFESGRRNCAPLDIDATK